MKTFSCIRKASSLSAFLASVKMCRCAKSWLTTASLSRGWMPETSRSFHHWHSAPRRRLLSWLANPGNPAMSPYTGKGRWVNSGKREGRGGKTAWMMSWHSSQRCKFTLKAHLGTPQMKSTWNSDACAYAKKTRWVPENADALCC